MNVLDKTGDNSVIFDFECDMSLTDDNFRIFFVIGEEFKHLMLSFSRNNKTVFAFAVYIFTANCHSVTVNGNNFEYTVLNFVK